MPAQNAQPASAAQKTELAAIAHLRLYPSLTNPSYLVLRSRRLLFSNWTRTLGNNLTVLDVGGRYQPYRPLLAPSLARYVAIDLIKTELTSVLADGAALPFAAASFDLVLATQVLDCIPDPKTAIHQIHLVLKPGGVFLASAPGFAPGFADTEQWRFTRTGLRTLLSPFSRVEIVPELSSVGSVFRTLNLAGDAFVRYNLARTVYRHTACPILNLLGLGFETLHLTTNDQFAANYSILATK